MLSPVKSSNFSGFEVFHPRFFPVSRFSAVSSVSASPARFLKDRFAFFPGFPIVAVSSAGLRPFFRCGNYVYHNFLVLSGLVFMDAFYILLKIIPFRTENPLLRIF